MKNHNLDPNGKLYSKLYLVVCNDKENSVKIVNKLI